MAECPDVTTPECAPYLRPRKAPAWRGRSSTLEGRWVTQGVPYLFHPWAERRGFVQPLCRRLDEAYVQERMAERDRGLREGVYRLPPTQDVKELVRLGHMVMPAFFVDKASRREVSTSEWDAMTPEQRIKHLRFVSNLKRLNRQCRKKSCKFEGLDKLPTMASRGRHKYASSWDVNSAFNLLEIQQSHQKYGTLDLGPSVDGPRYVMCAAMPFGYTNSPYVFTRVMRLPVGQMREEAIPTMIWLDDGLNLWESVEEGEAKLPRVEEILESWLGPGARHPTKGEGWPTPVPVLEKHLGFKVDLEEEVFEVTKDTQHRLAKMAKNILRSQAKHARWVNALWIAKFTGLAISTLKATTQARFRCRPLHDFLVDCGVHVRGWGPEVRGKLDRRQIRALEWWARTPQRNPRRAIWREPTTVVWATDASMRGHGGLDHAVALSKLPLGEEMGEATMGLWTPEERQMTICALELRAFRLKLEASGSTAAACGLLLLEDNMGVVGILNSFVTRSREMEEDLEKIMELLEKWDIDLRTRYIESAENPSDYFSREADKGDWSLDPGFVEPLLVRWGEVTVDRFADRYNNVVPRFNSMYPTAGTECMDAFTADWNGEVNWVNPPWRKLGQAVSKLDGSPDAEAVVLAPWWPAQPWFAALRRLSDEVVKVHVPGTEHALPDEAFRPGSYLRQAGLQPEPLRNRGWGLYAFHIPRRPDAGAE